jgi:hypothetical protein
LVVEPPVTGLNNESDFNDGGCTVWFTEAEVPLMLSVSVTGVGVVTCPNWRKKFPIALPAGMVKVAGTGATTELLLVSVITAPPAGATAVSWTVTISVPPLNGEVMVTEGDAAVRCEPTTNVPVTDHAVSAAVVGDASPFVAPMCQYFVPEVSDGSVTNGSESWLYESSIFLNCGSVAISNSYPAF